MIEIKVGRFGSADDSQRRIAAYQVAGMTVQSNEPLWPLEPYRIKQTFGIEQSSNNVEHVDFKRPRLRRTKGWLGDRMRHIKTIDHQAGTEVYIEGVGRLFVSANGSLIELPAWTDEVHRELLVEAAVGPALCLALAAHDVFCLHASAVVRHGTATLFCGPSGVGKSTLAQRLPGHPGFDLRLTDDVSATSIHQQSVSCLGHFPQLKLGVDEHYANAQSQSVPIEKVVLLRAARDECEFQSRQIDSAACLIALARHTVASRLFSPSLMKRHLSYCSMLASRVQVIEIYYPHTPAGVDLVVSALTDRAMDAAAN